MDNGRIVAKTNNRDSSTKDRMKRQQKREQKRAIIVRINILYELIFIEKT